MKAQELINKKAIRTTHITMAGGNVSRSFIEEPILILKATDTHIIYKWLNSDFTYLNDKPNILSYEYCDDNWIDYDELIDGIIFALDIDNYIIKNSVEDKNTEEIIIKNLNLDYRQWSDVLDCIGAALELSRNKEQVLSMPCTNDKQTEIINAYFDLVSVALYNMDLLE